MDLYIGQIMLVPYSAVPINTLPCDGRSLTRNDYRALFSLIGTTFGSNSSSTFNLPNLRSITPPGMMYAICTQGLWPPRP